VGFNRLKPTATIRSRYARKQLPRRTANPWKIQLHRYGSSSSPFPPFFLDAHSPAGYLLPSWILTRTPRSRLSKAALLGEGNDVLVIGGNGTTQILTVA
jgi:hypothetical protein